MNFLKQGRVRGKYYWSQTKNF